MFNSIFKAFSDMLRVSKIVSLKSWFHFEFEIKAKRGFSPSTYTTRKLTFEQLSSVLQKLWFSQVGSRLLETEVNSYQLSTIVTNSSILDVGRGPNLVKLIFVWQKSHLIQFKSYSWWKRLYGKITFTIAGSSLLLPSKIELFATVVECFQL